MQINIEYGKVSDLIYTLLTQTKARKFRTGFVKKNGEYRTGKFDLLNRKTWKQSDGTMYKRKGKKRTTNPDENILVHDLVKKAPRNIPVSRLLWFSVGRKIYKVQKLQDDHSRRIFMFERVKFNHLKLLMSNNIIGINSSTWLDIICTPTTNFERLSATILNISKSVSSEKPKFSFIPSTG